MVPGHDEGGESDGAGSSHGCFKHLLPLDLPLDLGELGRRQPCCPVGRRRTRYPAACGRLPGSRRPGGRCPVAGGGGGSRAGPGGDGGKKALRLCTVADFCSVLMISKPVVAHAMMYCTL
jgi:hypothetical protein